VNFAINVELNPKNVPASHETSCLPPSKTTTVTIIVSRVLTGFITEKKSYGRIRAQGQPGQKVC
jgi:hypothetical protein